MIDNTFPQYSLLQLRAKARLGIAGAAMKAEIDEMREQLNAQREQERREAGRDPYEGRGASSAEAEEELWHRSRGRRR